LSRCETQGCLSRCQRTYITNHILYFTIHISRMEFQFINFSRLENEKEQLRTSFLAKKPFHYLCFEQILHPHKAEEVLQAFPTVEDGVWDNTTYINQKNKFQKREFETGTVMDKVFKELNSPEFLALMAYITDIKDLQADTELFGGGLHQSITGAFLDVHVDYNFHPTTKFHRRLNILVYMNKDWKDDYEGHLELWDMDKREQVDRIAPLFNRCVIFQTNEVSFHGHPKPLKTPAGVTRKSLAAYYYTTERPEEELSSEHNTVYVNTEGLQGNVKNLQSGLKAFIERLRN
jgi:Rps23 Pro-64 3,4-dihydroxylase Tpa1-like proline 4-hydroxylase